MKFQKTINLTSYMVEYIDKRQPKPRTVHRETVVLDGDRLAALERLGMRPAGYIMQQFEREGYTVANIRRGESINARVDLSELWDETQQEIKAEHFTALAARLNEKLGGGSDADA